MASLLHDLDWVLPLRSDAATRLFEAFTALGYPTFYLALLPLGYWLWNKDASTRLAVLLITSAIVNGFLKDLFDDPRPAAVFALDGRVGDSYGLPSGHAQLATVTWYWLAWELRRAWAWVLATVMVLGIGFSRLYLGVHDVEDVAAGVALGVLSLFLFEWLLSERFAGWHRLDGRIQLVILLAVQPVLWLLWPEPGGPGALSALGAFLVGWWAGVLYDRHRLDFRRHPNAGRALVAAVVGIAIVFGLLTRLEGPLLDLGLGEDVARWLQTAVMALFVTAVAPWLFRHARLAA
ncbi:MAG: phosphatase PAP2 family protein [Pseudomonadales bacterium]|jgi:membrane-associated phospholipid phosphatase|nr:phosphatase PAP2 family protein [Pseudomonadales bacterium]